MRNGRRLSKFVGWRRRLGIATLAAVMGTTVSGDNRGVTASDLTKPFSHALDLARAWKTSASDTLSFGILYGTVLSRMEPGMRRSFVAAVEGVRDLCTEHLPAPVTRCTAKVSGAKKSVRCSRA